MNISKNDLSGLSLGAALGWLRMASGLTLREVEKKTGISNATICQIETGYTKNPGFLTVAKLAELYGVSLEMLPRK